MTTIITIFKWSLVIIATYAYVIIALYCVNGWLTGYQSPAPLTFSNVERKQVFDNVLDDAPSRVAVETTGYALASDYYQQQIGAAVNLYNLQTWAATVTPRMRVVEPFVARSKFIMPYDLSPVSVQATLRFNDYFNINYWNQYSNLDALVSWKQFIISKPSRMILVIISHKSTGQVVWEDKEIAKNEECHNKLQQFNNAYNHTIHSELNISIIRRVCFAFGSRTNESLSMKQFNYYIFKQWKPGQVLVWFSCWLGITKGRMSINGLQYQLSSKPYSIAVRSSRVNNDSMKYTINYLRPNYTAVSIRTVKPWMILSKRHELNYVRNHLMNCIKKLPGVLSHIRSTQHIYGLPMLAIDLGTYGDMSARKFIDKDAIEELLEAAVNGVYQNNMSIKEWEESFTTSIESTTDAGYIAAVQSALVAKADCLVMVGGHSRFQYNIVDNYLQRNRDNPCIHRVCYNDE